MFKLPYHTRVGNNINLQPVLQSLMKFRSYNFSVADSSLLENFLGSSDIIDPEVTQVYLVTEKWENIPYFSQILTSEHEFSKNVTIYYIDVRQQTRIVKDEVVFKSSNDEIFTILRLLLTIHWNSEGSDLFKSHVEYAGLVYSQWVTKAIAKVYPINTGNPATQMRVSVIAAIFFYSLFSDSPVVEERALSILARKISKTTRVPENMVMDIITQCGSYIKDVTAFSETIAQHSENVLLENFSTAKLFNSLASTWYGVNSNDHVACAIEFPPNLFAMILTAIKDNSYRKTTIGEIVKDNTRDPNLALLLTAFKKYDAII
jgi:hypothetical protein